MQEVMRILIEKYHFMREIIRLQDMLTDNGIDYETDDNDY